MLRVLVVGNRILPYRHAGDKNYWFEVLRELERRGHEIDVISVTHEPIPDPAPYSCEYVAPVKFDLGGSVRFNPEYRWLRASGSYGAKTLSFGRIMSAVRRHVRARRPDIIHLTTNYGPIMGLAKPFSLRVPISVSVPTYNGWRFVYDWALRASLTGFDRVVPLSEAYARRLEALGMRRRRIRTIRWAVNTDEFHPPSDSERTAARRALGVKDTEKMVFWSGFLQQMVPRDFEFAIRTAEAMLRSDPGKWRFCFCLKPEHYDPEYRRFVRPGIEVVGSGEQFRNARTAADAMLSPITDLRSTAAPPLTWIECMALGVPILTTPLPGVEELVTDQVDGVVASTPDALAERSAELLRTPEGLAMARRQARQRVEDRFALASSVTEYVRLWEEMNLEDAHH